MAGFFKNLRERVFGKSKTTKPGQKTEAPSPAPAPTERLHPEKSAGTRAATAKVAPPGPPPTERLGGSERDPYFVQIGFDFGTAFSKCVCRDIFTDKAWIHLPFGENGNEAPFLIPSTVCFDGKAFRHPNDSSGAYEDGGLYHVKMALEKIALKKWKDPVLQSYRAVAPDSSNEGLRTFVECCAIYLLGTALGGIRKDVRDRFSGHVAGDYLAVNMAVPVSNADHPRVNELFDQTLRIAWMLSDELTSRRPRRFQELATLIRERAALTNDSDVSDRCFIYPEVSANVQGFVRSRTSREGIYLFSDTGAGTVDQSVFVYARPDGKDHLTYLHASVLPLGSSHLERLAAARDGDGSWQSLERWRQLKECGDARQELQTARKTIGKQLRSGTESTISLAKQKLKRRLQMSQLRVIFGGGGHCENPYRASVIEQFDGRQFRQDDIEARRNAGDSFDLGMPIPRDLELDGHQRRWMDRLTVAYGLSFEKGQLASFTLPQAVATPSEKELWRPRSRRMQAPSKDEC